MQSIDRTSEAQLRHIIQFVWHRSSTGPYEWDQGVISHFNSLRMASALTVPTIQVLVPSGTPQPNFGKLFITLHQAVTLCQSHRLSSQIK
jgi:hypothetical protein